MLTIFLCCETRTHVPNRNLRKWSVIRAHYLALQRALFAWLLECKIDFWFPLFRVNLWQSLDYSTIRIEQNTNVPNLTARNWKVEMDKRIIWCPWLYILKPLFLFIREGFWSPSLLPGTLVCGTHLKNKKKKKSIVQLNWFHQNVFNFTTNPQVVYSYCNYTCRLSQSHWSLYSLGCFEYVSM